MRTKEKRVRSFGKCHFLVIPELTAQLKRQLPCNECLCECFGATACIEFDDLSPPNRYAVAAVMATAAVTWQSTVEVLGFAFIVSM